MSDQALPRQQIIVPHSEQNQEQILLIKEKLLRKSWMKHYSSLKCWKEFNQDCTNEIKELYTEGEILLKIIVASIVSSR